jgi:hypothetical protein
MQSSIETSAGFVKAGSHGSKNGKRQNATLRSLVKTLLKFRGVVLPPSSKSESKPNKQSGRRITLFSGT